MEAMAVETIGAVYYEIQSYITKTRVSFKKNKGYSDIDVIAFRFEEERENKEKERKIELVLVEVKARKSKNKIMMINKKEIEEHFNLPDPISECKKKDASNEDEKKKKNPECYLNEFIENIDNFLQDEKNLSALGGLKYENISKITAHFIGNVDTLDENNKIEVEGICKEKLIEKLIETKGKLIEKIEEKIEEKIKEKIQIENNVDTLDENSKIKKLKEELEKLIEFKISSTFDIICEIIKQVQKDKSGKRYGNPILDLIREFNRYIFKEEDYIKYIKKLLDSIFDYEDTKNEKLKNEYINLLDTIFNDSNIFTNDDKKDYFQKKLDLMK